VGLADDSKNLEFPGRQLWWAIFNYPRIVPGWIGKSAFKFLSSMSISCFSLKGTVFSLGGTVFLLS
jgi:hypothetical protein